MAAPGSDSFIQRLIDKFNQSRFFTVSLLLHIVLVAIFGTTVLFQAIQEPSDFEGGEGGFVDDAAMAVAPPAPAMQQPTTFTVTAPSQPTTSLNAITTMNPETLDFSMNTVMAPPTVTPSTTTAATAAPAAMPTNSAGMSKGDAAAIAATVAGWGKGNKTGSGTGVRQREFQFVAYLGKYKGGNWDSTVRVSRGKIDGGSLPNLLYLISKWSRDKIKTNERNVEAVELDSDRLFADPVPPFVFITGSRDFVLTEKEVENLRKYVKIGGAIWGDSSVPGERSRFDIAFRREMRRVIPDVDKEFEPLPENHPIFTNNYFPEIKSAPAGLNYYQEPVYALRIFGEIAILYTANDYGDMWQVGLGPDGKIDLGKDEKGQYIAVNQNIWERRGVYLHNIDEESIERSFKFGINVITHLLTRWDNKVNVGSRL